MRRPRSLIPLLISAMLMLNACGDTRWERAGNGAILGVAAGGAAGGLCCQDPIDGSGRGALIGAAIGALIGFVLNEPIFFNKDRK